jgi:protein-S-isoprenylcysteine O-methyltransferase Ste14
MRIGRSWINAALRSLVWLAAAVCWVYLKKPAGASFLDVRTGLAGGLGLGLLAAGVALHVWSNLTLARAEAIPLRAPERLVVGGPFQYVRNPIYLAGIPIFLGIYVLYAQPRAVDLVAPLALGVTFHLLVVRGEEPSLRRRLGPAYAEYCRRIPRWFPRLKRGRA